MAWVRLAPLVLVLLASLADAASVEDLVKQLRGRDQERDLVLLLRVPKEVLQRADSPIVLPGEEGPPK